MEDYKKEDVLRNLYWEKEMSTTEIGNKYEISQSTVVRNMEKCGVNRRKSNTNKAGCHFFSTQGYSQFKVQRGEDVSYVLIHRLVAVAKFGIKEVFDKVVHHKNGITWDNRPENIEIMSRSDHTKLHHGGDE